MKVNITRRLGSTLGAFALAAAGVLVVANPAAAAEDSFSFQYNTLNNGDGVIIANNNSWGGEAAGSAEWRADPRGSLPGDALIATDVLGDGYGIEARLSNGRVASTRGHSAPYTVTKTGDVPETNSYTMRLCVVKGTYEKCSSSINVHA
ncbi:hypothetical protein ABT097_24975 [Streptomyces sp. NPDC002225]|uniref:hypothetical protein n=1 Tax=Streptomyces sp. NPDC002225 TaxID=3154413 RepID=UPI0033297EB9